MLGEARSHRELTDLFAILHLEEADPDSGQAKWRRVRGALARSQESARCGNHVGAFIQAVMDPVNYVHDGDKFEALRERTNKILALSGLSIHEDGKLRAIPRATTIDEAAARASRLRTLLKSRDVHADVLRFCRPELLQENYFHAVLEATKSVAEKIRVLSGLTSDGAELATSAFGGKEPVLAINSLRTDTERSEQRGFMNMLVGTFGTFRNPTAHAPRVSWPIPEEDALDLLSLASYLHRRLDRTVRAVFTGLTPREP